MTRSQGVEDRKLESSIFGFDTQTVGFCLLNPSASVSSLYSKRLII